MGVGSFRCKITSYLCCRESVTRVLIGMTVVVSEFTERLSSITDTRFNVESSVLASTITSTRSNGTEFVFVETNLDNATREVDQFELLSAMTFLESDFGALVEALTTEFTDLVTCSGIVEVDATGEEECKGMDG